MNWGQFWKIIAQLGIGFVLVVIALLVIIAFALAVIRHVVDKEQ